MNKFEKLRSYFPLTEKGTFLDVSYDNGGSELCMAALRRYMDCMETITPNQIKAGGAGRGKTIEVVEETRKLAAQLIGASDPDCIAFTKNTNEGISCVLMGYAFEKGDNIVCDSVEHVSVLMPCLNMKNYDIDCKIAKPSDGICIKPEELLAVCDEHTKFIVVSHIQSASGYRIDLKKLCEMAHKRGIYVVADAIQSIGFRPFKVEEFGVDAACAAGYKGLLSIDGIGIFYCAHGLLEKLHPCFAADNAAWAIDKNTWTLNLVQPDKAYKFENSSMNIAGIFGLNAGIKALLDIGDEALEEHTTKLFNRLYDGFLELGIKPATPKEAEKRSHCVSVVYPDLKDAYDYFMNHKIFISLSGGKYIRASIPVFANEEDIDNYLKATKAYLESKK